MIVVNGRTCLCCRKSKNKDELFRFAVINGELVLSPNGGRGIYLCKDKKCIERAFNKGLIERNGKFANREKEMEKLKSSLSPSLFFLGLLNKGGKLCFGSALVKGHKKAALVLLASDASDNTKDQFANDKALLCYNKAELGSALGYEELSAVSINDAKAAKAFIEKAKAEGRKI